MSAMQSGVLTEYYMCAMQSGVLTEYYMCAMQSGVLTEPDCGSKSKSPVASSNTMHACDHMSHGVQYLAPRITSGARYLRMNHRINGGFSHSVVSLPCDCRPLDFVRCQPSLASSVT